MNKKISFVDMRRILLKRFYLIGFFMICLISQVCSQLNHFIYLQTDNQQPFYLKYNNRIISSTASGYLILSKLKEGAANFSIGFPKSDQTEQNFLVLIDKADKGFLIKNFSERGWGLFDLQSSAVLYALKTEQINQKNGNDTVAAIIPVTDDPFANMLSKVTQDSTVKNVSVVKAKNEIKLAPVVNQVIPNPVPEKKDSIKINIPEVSVTTIHQEVKETPWVVPIKSVIQQINKFISSEGTDYVFEILNTDGSPDTVRLFISNHGTEKKPIQQTVLIPEKKDTIEIIKPDVQQPVINNEIKVEPTPQVPIYKKKDSIKTIIPNSNCKVIALEDDFIKLRRKMVNESNEEKMIFEAKKVLKSKCFSTIQIRNLAVLFLTDKGRYLFYEASLPFVTDFSNFKSLEETLSENQYKKLFQELLPNQ
jgi:hypothetical protein